MTHFYKEALAIGTAAEGIIKCTWAAIYDKDDNKLFSLQNRNFSRETIIPDDRIWDKSVVADTTEDGFSLNLAWTSERVFEPVVVAREYKYGYKVPVELTANAKIAILEMLNLKKKWYEEAKTNDPVLAERRKKTAAKLQKRINYFENLGTVYVKPKAFHWYPLNTFALTGEDVEAAKRSYELSKKILAASAATTIL